MCKVTEIGVQTDLKTKIFVCFVYGVHCQQIVLDKWKEYAYNYQRVLGGVCIDEPD